MASDINYTKTSGEIQWNVVKYNYKTVSDKTTRLADESTKIAERKTMSSEEKLNCDKSLTWSAKEIKIPQNRDGAFGGFFRYWRELEKLDMVKSSKKIK